MRRVARVITRIVVFWAALCVVLFAVQRRLLYQAPSSDPGDGSPIAGVRCQGVELPGGGYAAWIAPRDDLAPVAVLFHGNAELVSGQGHVARPLAAAGIGLLAVEYPGYGPLAAESPTEESIYAAAEAGLDWLAGRGVERDRIVLVGRSLGSGPAVEMARRRRGAALVLVAPFTSITALARRIAPWAPVGILLRDRFDNLAKAGEVGVPVTILHGDRDRVVPIAHGRGLAEALPDAELRVLPGVDHIDIPVHAMIVSLVHETLARRRTGR